MSSGRADVEKTQLHWLRPVISQEPSARAYRSFGREEINVLDEATVREKAYELWEQAGRPEGGDLAFCDQARHQLEADQPPPDVDLLDSAERIESSGEQSAG
ncbi:DUF2934 domain-containing protein [Pseudomonas syringae]|nr:DUF2934 domain-containing protein [Pseudomonas syringae]